VARLWYYVLPATGLACIRTGSGLRQFLLRLQRLFGSCMEREWVADRRFNVDDQCRITAFTMQGFTPVFKGVLWDQGEA